MLKTQTSMAQQTVHNADSSVRDGEDAYRARRRRPDGERCRVRAGRHAVPVQRDVHVQRDCTFRQPVLHAPPGRCRRGQQQPLPAVRQRIAARLSAFRVHSDGRPRRHLVPRGPQRVRLEQRAQHRHQPELRLHALVHGGGAREEFFRRGGASPRRHPAVEPRQSLGVLPHVVRHARRRQRKRERADELRHAHALDVLQRLHAVDDDRGIRRVQRWRHLRAVAGRRHVGQSGRGDLGLLRRQQPGQVPVPGADDGDLQLRRRYAGRHWRTGDRRRRDLAPGTLRRRSGQDRRGHRLRRRRDGDIEQSLGRDQDDEDPAHLAQPHRGIGLDPDNVDPRLQWEPGEHAHQALHRGGLASLQLHADHCGSHRCPESPLHGQHDGNRVPQSALELRRLRRLRPNDPLPGNPLSGSPVRNAAT